MDTATPPITDPAALIEQLDPEAIRAELDDLARRRSALCVLLRSALARRRRDTTPQGQEVRGAD